MKSLFDGDTYWCGDDDCAKEILKSRDCNCEDMDVDDEDTFEWGVERYELKECRDSDGTTQYKVVNEEYISVAYLKQTDSEFLQWLKTALNDDHNYDDDADMEV
jgi:hypothetical protein